MGLNHAARVCRNLPDLEKAVSKADPIGGPGAFEAARLIVTRGRVVASPAAPLGLAIHCIRGHVLVQGDRHFELRAGHWVHLAADTPHRVYGIDDASLLAAIIKREGRSAG
jgi:quercetin dioxygenase-like cupin family protein